MMLAAPNIDQILTTLNAEQRAAVCHEAGPLMVIAGAGTGKTRVITYRIAYLVSQKLAYPREILALTFTEKAATEMAERVDVLLPYGYADVWISTFHSFGDRILRDYSLELGLSPDFRVLSRPEQNIFFQEHLFEFPLAYYRPLSNPTRFIDALLSLMSRAKDEAVLPEDYQRYAVELQRLTNQSPTNQELAELARQQSELAQTYQKYQTLMQANGLLDFGDQISLTLRALREHPLILERLRSRFKYILVDEFQDTNYAQFQLVQLLAGQHTNITVVGDDDQSIYRFRGAAMTNIQSFLDIYPEARRVVLIRNYRSNQSVLDAAYRLISCNNPERLEVRAQVNKRLIGKMTEQTAVRHLHFNSLSAEADEVAKMIEEKVKSGAYQYKDFAILVRANNDADPFMRALNMLSIPYHFSGSRGLYNQPEVRLLISFLRVLTNYHDSISLYHLASSEIYQFPITELALCLSQAHQTNRSLYHILSHLNELPEISALSAEGQATAQKIVQDLTNYLELAREHAAGVVLYQFLTRSGYLKHLVNQATPVSELMVLNIAKFFTVVRNYSEIGVKDQVQTFSRHLDLLIDAGDDPATVESDLDLNVVNILTVHKAKGLEFPVVFMVSLIKDKFPTRRRTDLIELPEELLKEELPTGDFHLQEERRLFYVGMTRAQNELYLTSARDYGGRSSRKVSEFVLEALDKPVADENFIHPSAIETIEQFAPAPEPSLESPGKIPDDQVISLSHYQIDDYLTCPLKYKYAHVLHVPILPHHSTYYGRAIHQAVQEYNRRKALDRPISLEEVLTIFKNQWLNNGFLSREHEEQRFKMGQLALTRFYQQQEAAHVKPTIVEQTFTFFRGNNRVTGRWDRIDVTDDQVVIIDFKTTEIFDQDKANEKAKSNLQLGLYTLAYVDAYGQLPQRLELYFLESGLVGCAGVTEKMLKKTEEHLATSATGIRERDYTPTPNYLTCSYCPFSVICPATTA